MVIYYRYPSTLLPPISLKSFYIPRHDVAANTPHLSDNVSAVATPMSCDLRKPFSLAVLITQRIGVVCCRDFYARNQIRDSDHVHPCADSIVMCRMRPRWFRRRHGRRLLKHISERLLYYFIILLFTSNVKVL